MQLDRVVVLVVDALGVGAQGDAARYGDEAADTLSNLSVQLGGITLPHFLKYGLGYLTTILGVPPVALPGGAFGKMRRLTDGKTTAAGYGELVGQREPEDASVLDALVRKLPVVAIGPLAQVPGAAEIIAAEHNVDALSATRDALDRLPRGLIWTRLPDLRAHRHDAAGYYRALQIVDAFLPRLVEKLGERDLLIVTSDQGGDPTIPGAEPTREEVPLLCIGQKARGRALGTRVGFYDVAQTLCDAFALPPWPRGESLLPAVS